MKLLAENELMQQSVQQAGDVLIDFFWGIFLIVLVMALIGIGFMYIKYKITKKIKEKINEKKHENENTPLTK